MTSEQDFQKYLDEHPDDHHTRQVFADWLEEQGDPRAKGYRALGLLGKIPIPYSANGSSKRGAENEGIPFEPAYHIFWRGPDKDLVKDELPVDWIKAIVSDPEANRIRNYHSYDQDSSRIHLTRRHMEDAAAHAFSQLPEERQQEIMQANKIGYFLKSLGEVLRYAGEDLRTHYDNFTSALKQKQFAKLPILARKLVESGKPSSSYLVDFHAKHLPAFNRAYKEAQSSKSHPYVSSAFDLLRSHYNIPSHLPNLLS